MTNCLETLIEDIMTQIRGEVEKMCGKCNFENDTLDDAEQSARIFAQKCGIVAFETHLKLVLEAQNSGYVGHTIVLPNGNIAAFERYESRWIRTHLGRHRFDRAYYWDPAGNGGVLPLDEKWNLDEREPSPSLRTSIGMLGAEMPFKRGKELMKQISMIDLPDKRIQESSEAVGEKIFHDGFVESRESLPLLEDRQAIPLVHPSAKRGTLYVQMDGGRLNTVTEGWREPKVATLYWGEDLEQVSEIRNKIVQKEYIAVLGDADELTGRIWAAACRWEWWKAQRVVVLGDGALWIWNRAKMMFPNATLILDLYHAKEHIWSTARKLFGGVGKQKDKGAEKKERTATQKAKDKKTNQWAQARIAELKGGNLDTLITNLQTLEPKGKAKEESVTSLINYFEENKDRTDYKTYKSLGLTVGSGCIESGVKNIVNQRMKGCGMRWAVDRAEYMLNLRAAYLSTIGIGRQRLVA